MGFMFSVFSQIFPFLFFHSCPSRNLVSLAGGSLEYLGVLEYLLHFLADALSYFPKSFVPLIVIIEASLVLHSTCTIIHIDGFMLATRFHCALAIGIVAMREYMLLSSTVSGWFLHWQMYITFLRNPKKSKLFLRFLFYRTSCIPWLFEKASFLLIATLH